METKPPPKGFFKNYPSEEVSAAKIACVSMTANFDDIADEMVTEMAAKGIQRERLAHFSYILSRASVYR